MIQDHIFNKHHDHEVVIDGNPINKKGKPGPHLAALRCVTCNKHLKWLGGSELVALGEITSAEWQEYQLLQRMAKHEANAMQSAWQEQPVQDSW
jgi:hypothetical protein